MMYLEDREISLLKREYTEATTDVIIDGLESKNVANADNAIPLKTSKPHINPQYHEPHFNK